MTGTLLLGRTLHPPEPVRDKVQGAWRTLVTALGAPGLLYVAIVPFVLGAAAALRYVHILSHVAEVLASG